MLNILSALAVALLFCSVGVYHILKGREKSRELYRVMLSYGFSWIVIGASYLCVAAGQIAYDHGQVTASREFFYLTYVIPLAVIIPFYYFASYLLWGNRALSKYLMAAAVALFAVGTGLVMGIPVEALDLGWMVTWDFTSKAFNAYFFMVGSLPALASLAGFMFYLFPASDSRLVRYRIALISAAYFLVVAAWSTLVFRTAPGLVVSRAISLAAGVCAQLAYFPPSFIARRLSGPAPGKEDREKESKRHGGG